MSTFSLVVSQREIKMGMMEHALVLYQGEGFTKFFLKDIGWTMMEQMRNLPQIDEFPNPDGRQLIVHSVNKL